MFAARYGLIAYIHENALVFTAWYGRIAYIHKNALVFTARYGLIAYTQQIVFSVYSAVGNDCLYTAYCV